MKHGLNTDSEIFVKPALIFLLINGEVDGPHETTEILNRLSGETLDEKENPVEPLPENTPSCIEGMHGWRSLPETLIWSHAKLLSEFPNVPIWIQKIADCTFEMPGLRKLIRQTLKCSPEDWNSTPDYLWRAIEANGLLLRQHRDYLNRDQHWDIGAMEFYPAMELQFFNREVPTRDWRAEWIGAGGKIYNGKMIARKDDHAWLAISDFGYPFPPFDFDQSAFVTDVSVKKAREAGLNLSPIQLATIKPFQIIGL